MIKWLKNLFCKKDQKRLGECTLQADSPEQAVTVALTWMTGGQVSAYTKGDCYDIHVYEASKDEHNGFYQLPLDKVSPKDVLGMTLAEFVDKFKVSDKTIEIEEIA